VIVAPVRVSALPTQATVIVAGADGAKVYVDGKLLTQATSPRTFVSPELPTGKDYYYTLKVERNRDGKTIAETRRVDVRAGQVVRVDLDASAVAAAPRRATAKLTVRLPQDARLTVDGVVVPITTGTQTFQTPQLEAGRKYYYTVRAEVVRGGQPRADSRRVIVEAGKTAEVDFRNLGTVQTASR
jgi:uncharacterized protein (TIGR03000 family)